MLAAAIEMNSIGFTDQRYLSLKNAKISIYIEYRRKFHSVAVDPKNGFFAS